MISDAHNTYVQNDAHAFIEILREPRGRARARITHYVLQKKTYIYNII